MRNLKRLSDLAVQSENPREAYLLEQKNKRYPDRTSIKKDGLRITLTGDSTELTDKIDSEVTGYGG